MRSIVAVDKNWGIGRNNDLLFSIPEDMKFFREKTKESRNNSTENKAKQYNF